MFTVTKCTEALLKILPYAFILNNSHPRWQQSFIPLTKHVEVIPIWPQKRVNGSTNLNA